MDAATAYSLWGSLHPSEQRREQIVANNMAAEPTQRLISRLGLLSVRVFEADLSIGAFREYVRILDTQWSKVTHSGQ